MSADRRPPKEIAISVVQRGEFLLIGKRPDGVPLAGLWEFPGGKIRSGESPAEAARRECLEETGLHVDIVDALATIDHRYEHAHLRLYFFLGSPIHDQEKPAAPFRWVARTDLAEYEFPPANNKVIRLLQTIQS